MKYPITIMVIIFCIPLLFMSCVSLPHTKCMEKRDLAVEKYFTRIDGLNIAQDGKGPYYFVMTEKGFDGINERYDALVDYVNCFEGK